MIRLEGISKRFGPIEALRPLDLEIRKGEWLGLFGHNGSGKTTLIRILLGLSRPSTGRLLLDGKSPDGEAWRAFRSRFGFMPERIAFYENMTGQEILRYFARLRGVRPKATMPMLERVGLSDAAHRRVGDYSKGMRQRLNLAQALLGDPEVLILDEPIEGLDPRGVHGFFGLLQSGSIHTVVLSSHRLSQVCRRVDRVCILDEGEVKACGLVGELYRDSCLPVRIHIYPSESANGALDAALNRPGITSLVRREGKVVVEVPQSEKIAFLTGLQACREEVRHLHIEEPSLEEVYFETG